MDSSPRVNARFGLVALIFLAFISLGLPDGLLGVAWPSLRNDFKLPLDAIGPLLITGTSGYLLASFLSGALLARFNVGAILAASCALTGAGLIACTLAPVWWVMVALGVLLGLGAGAIDAGLNTYVATHFGARLMQWLHACYGIGVTLGPFIMTFGLTTFASWRWGYAAVGVAQLTLAAAFLPTLPWWRAHASQTRAGTTPRLTDYRTPFLRTLRQPLAQLSLALFFLYAGVEAILGLWTYSLLTEARHVTPAVAGLWTGGYWAMFACGRIAAGVYIPRIATDSLVRISLGVALAGVALLWWNPARGVSLPAVALAGLAIAPIFPALVSGTAARVGQEHAANAIGMQMSAAGLGLALLPALAGVLARGWSLEIIPALLAALLASLMALHALTRAMLIRARLAR